MEIEAVYRELEHPFPYADCRALARASEDQALEHLIPDLDLYLGNVAGYASAPKRFVRYAPDQLETIRRALGRSFFEACPRYASLRSAITAQAAPDLFRCLEATERARALLLELIAFL